MSKKQLQQKIEELEKKIEKYEKLIRIYGEDYQKWFKILLEHFDLVIDFSGEEPRIVRNEKTAEEV